jgi:hypothetical protein
MELTAESFAPNHLIGLHIRRDEFENCEMEVLPVALSRQSADKARAELQITQFAYFSGTLRANREAFCATAAPLDTRTIMQRPKL